MSVRPYQDITFGADGDVDLWERDRLLALEATDLILFAHGRHDSPALAKRLASAFFDPFPALLAPGVRLGYAGVVWPSMAFADEPIPGVAADPAAATSPDPVPVADPAAATLDPATRKTLGGLFPGHGPTVDRLALLLARRPPRPEAFAEFGRLARGLAQAPAGSLEHCSTDDLPQDEEGPVAVLYEDALTLCRDFAQAVGGQRPTAGAAGTATAPGRPAHECGGPAYEFGGPSPERHRDPAALAVAWTGAKELLRQTTYHAMKRRAGAVGELGLGPLLGQLARRRPALRIHLVGHGQGARLVAFALRGLPDGVRTVKSLTLLQGAFSHYAFAPSLPHAARHAGALRGMEHRVDGPVVACYSRHDSALAALYPLASRLAGDDRLPPGLDRRWWAVGHDGLRAVPPPAVRLTLAQALARGVPERGCVSVDTAAVVRRGGPPTGAHYDICHGELARVVVSAGRMDR
ncbi:serine-threonine protein kinase [Streptomyces sp. NPDC057638]|uniref:serine-threonine protein kinase n=1 Tax=Streptomyces sp. NPDC057638 TaxID=3346190 RepID=UPI0036B03DE1